MPLLHLMWTSQLLCFLHQFGLGSCSCLANFAVPLLLDVAMELHHYLSQDNIYQRSWMERCCSGRSGLCDSVSVIIITVLRKVALD